MNSYELAEMLRTNNVRIWRLVRADVLRPTRSTRTGRGGKGTALLMFDENEQRAARAVMAFGRTCDNSGHPTDYDLLRAIAEAARRPTHLRWIVVRHFDHATFAADDETAAAMTDPRILIEVDAVSYDA